ncbi:hypothetical protein C8Q75DRAFT_559342 [Abortiporus biennis]|nr:hypothetical protein C8Q75DRAFT_559342 [Abortiporus biennis]
MMAPGASLPAQSSTVLLGKRKERSSNNSIVFHLSSPPPLPETTIFSGNGSGKDTAAGSSFAPTEKVIKPYICTFEGCKKTYAKPSRLNEHFRSHTGDRPYVCITCSRTYLRESHLQAHNRSHLPNSARPFECDENDCGKRFWTSQHLQVHMRLHRGEKSFKCTEPSCNASFAKHHQLRSHICTTHSPPGTKPYLCEHSNCSKSFDTNQKLRSHMKTHDAKRYSCTHPSCMGSKGVNALYFQTWSSLQEHMRIAHPPTCPHPSCNGRIFKQQSGLRLHLKVHDQKDVETQILCDNDSEHSDPDNDRPKKRRRGGEIGRDWACEIEGCDKDFKSKKALMSHHKVSHLGRRDFVCPHESCKRAFGYKHILKNHLDRVHALETSDEDDFTSSHSDVPDIAPATFDIDDITGVTYRDRSQQQLLDKDFLCCPYPHMDILLSASDMIIEGSSKQCLYVFRRAYDLRRHLKAEHSLEVDKEVVEQYVRVTKKDKSIS